MAANSGAQSRILERCAGKPVTAFVRDACELLTDIAEISVRTFPVTGTVSERIASQSDDSERQIADRVALCGYTGWEARAHSHMTSAMPLPDTLMAEAMKHEHGDNERVYVLRREQVIQGQLDAIGDTAFSAEGVAICSEVRLRRGYTAHLPMLDFACPTSDGNATTIRAMLATIGCSGALINSGQSYHFIGLSLLTADEWRRFMGHALLMAPLIDCRFVGHRLIDGECRLRIFAHSKIPQTPVVEGAVYASFAAK